MKKDKSIMQKTVLFLLLSTFLFASCVKKEQIEELKTKIDTLASDVNLQLNNQTLLFNKVIGEAIPVIVPEESQEKLETLLNSLKVLEEDLNDEKLENSVNLYLDFIKTTAPWIQESVSEDIFYAKYTIDYLTILNNYQNKKDINEVVDSLQTFIITNNDYKDINLIIEKYNSLVDEQNILYDNTISELNSKMEAAFDNPSVTYDELMEILNSVEPYVEVEMLQANIKKLDTYIAEKDSLEQVTEELNTLRTLLDENTETQYKEQSYNIYAEQLALCNYKLGNIKSINHDEASNLLRECTSKIVAYDNNIQRQQEEDLLKQIQESLAMCNTEISNLSTDAISSSMMPILASQLASLKFNAENFSIISNYDILRNIQDSIDSLNNKEIEISKKNTDLDNAKIKNYNRSALNRIENIQKQNEQIVSGFLGYSSENKEKAINLLLQLEAIQSNYLYTSIASVYQQLYSDLWGKLDSESRFIVSRRALNITKEEL